MVNGRSVNQDDKRLWKITKRWKRINFTVARRRWWDDDNGDDEYGEKENDEKVNESYKKDVDILAQTSESDSKSRRKSPKSQLWQTNLLQQCTYS